jgi:hypothetical protein
VETELTAEQKIQEQQLHLLDILANTTKSGWLQKCGHIRKNWTKRWFVLDRGVLRYYKSALAVAPFGKDLKGEVHLDHFLATFVVGGDERESTTTTSAVGAGAGAGAGDDCSFSIYNTLEYNNKQKVPRRKNIFRKEEHFILEMKADTTSCAQEWIAAVNGHIEYFYKSKFDNLLVDDIFSEGWLYKKSSWTKIWHKRWFVLKTNKLGKHFSPIHIIS